MSACLALAGAALFRCLAANPACLPPQYPSRLVLVLEAIAEQESGFRPYAIRDEATGEPAYPATHADAVSVATALDAKGHKLGLGLMQITGRANWDRHGLTIATALDPCANLRAGASHFAADLHAASSRYNSGRFDGAPTYAASIMRRLGAAPAATPAAAAPPAPAAPACAPSWEVWASCPAPARTPDPADADEAPPSAAPVLLRGRLAMDLPQ